MYINRASLNTEYFQMLKFLGLIQNYKILMFQVQAREQEEDNDEFLGFVQTLKNFVQKQNKDLSKKIDFLSANLAEQMEQNFAKLTERVMHNEEALGKIHKDVSKAVEQNRTEILKEIRSMKSGSAPAKEKEHEEASAMKLNEH